MFESGHLALVLGAQLSDGREVVIKVRPQSPRLQGCAQVQRRLFEAGYPCPQPLAGPARLGGLVATAESFLPGGQQMPPVPDRPARFADALVGLVDLAPPVEAVSSLDPPPPWAWPDPGRLWPAPDDLEADLNDHPGPSWLDELAGDVRRRLLASALPSVVGHVDFESQNVRWSHGSLHVVHDWDSVAALPEPVIAGLAAAVFTADGRSLTDATVEETRGFLAAYQARRRVRWAPPETAVAWAAGLWVRAFNAKKAYVRGDGAPGERLQAETQERHTASFSRS
jgi:hypothetical protein